MKPSAVIRIEDEQEPLFIVLPHVHRFSYQRVADATFVWLRDGGSAMIPGDHTQRIAEAVDAWHRATLP